MDYPVAPNNRVPYDLLHEDEALLVVGKPAGVVTQPGKKHECDSLLNGLFASYGDLLRNLGAARNYGLLHRLDRETSGLVLVALRNRAYDDLRGQFENRKVRKTYWAIVLGCPRPAQAVLQQPIAEVVGSRKKAVIRRDGQQAITAYRVLESTGDVSLVEARPKTGRLHQIRVHLAHQGHPVLGEDVYASGVRMPSVSRLCLHACELSFIHPVSTHRLVISSPWPEDLVRTAKRLGLLT